MDNLANARRFIFLISCAINSADDVHALALLRAAAYLMDAARADLNGQAPAPTLS